MQQSFFNSICQILILDQVPYIFVLIIVSAFLYALIGLGRTSKKLINKSISNAIIALNDISDHQDFYEKFEFIKSKFSEDKVLQESWNEFCESVIIDTENQKIIATKRPHEYFNEQSIISPHINLRQLHAIPNYLIGLGLLFTFIGLIAGIHFAAQGLGSPNGGQEALKKLLQMAGVKFVSSITGLFFSIVLSISQKHWFNHVSKNIHNICTKIEKLTDSIAIEQLIYESIKDQKHQTVVLEHLATDIGLKVTDALSNKLPDSVAMAMKPLVDALTTVAQKLSTVNNDSLEQMLNSFMKKLDGAAQNEIQDLVLGLKDMQASLQGLLQHIHQTGESFGSKIVSAASELGSTLMPVSENFLTFNANIKEINEKMYHQLDRFDNNILSLNTTLENIKQTVDHVHQAGQPLSHAAEGIKKASHSIEIVYQQLQTAYDNSQQALNTIQKVSENMVSAWNNYQERFKTVDEDMAKAFMSIHDGLVAFKKNTSSFVSEFDQNFTRAIGHLSGAIEELAEERAEILESR